MKSQLTVGFDLDMTLVDSAEGISEAIVAVCALHGVQVEREEAVETIGLPLDLVFPRWLPELPYEQLLDEYRDHYGRYGIPKSRLLPGAAESVDAIRASGGRVVVVSAKKSDFVQRVLDVVGLHADAIHGYLFAEKKGEALLEERASVYVGDHLGDIAAARTAQAVSVAVATGPTAYQELKSACPDVLMRSLEEFPPWYEVFRAKA